MAAFFLNSIEFPKAAERFLSRAGFKTDFQISPLKGGANNRAFRVHGPKKDAFLKFYFSHPNDSRDRLAHEFQFSNFAWQNGLRRLPRPLAREAAHHWGLYEFIDGRILKKKEISRRRVLEAAQFFRTLNQHKANVAARKLPAASEACFSLAQHLACVDKRVRSLARVKGTGAVWKEARTFIRKKFVPLWTEIRRDILRSASRYGQRLNASLAWEQRRLSPSDFGFHNALLDRTGALKFIDFEYAGWDDPAKMVCDFFCQPQRPVAKKDRQAFVDAIVKGSSDAEALWNRIVLLFPAYQIKWCAIVLNDFLPVARERRRFAGRSDSNRMSEQLKKAKRLLQIVAKRNPLF